MDMLTVFFLHSKEFSAVDSLTFLVVSMLEGRGFMLLPSCCRVAVPLHQ